MTAAELIAAIEETLGALQPFYRGEAAESDLYEATLLSIAIDAAEAVGGQVLLTIDGVNACPELTFRRNPGNLWLGAFTFGVITFPGSPKSLEAHLGVKVAGASGVAHECDIALIDGAEARRSRAGAVHPRRVRLVAAIEAKHYSASPDIGIGRAFLGLGVELGHRRCALAFPATTSASLAALLAPKDSECFDEVTPGSAAAMRLRSRLEQQIRNWLA